MSKLTTNRSDWSGEEITVEVDRENLSWEQCGYKFHLKWVAFEEDLHPFLGPGGYQIIGEGWDHPLGIISGSEADSGEISRFSEDPVEAAVKLLCNII